VAYIDDACRVIDEEDAEKTKNKLKSKGAIIIKSDDVNFIILYY
jgi:hypothetical protein